MRERVVSVTIHGAHYCPGRILPARDVTDGKIEGNRDDDHKPGEPNQESNIGIIGNGGHPVAKEFR